MVRITNPGLFLLTRQRLAGERGVGEVGGGGGGMVGGFNVEKTSHGF